MPFKNPTNKKSTNSKPGQMSGSATIRTNSTVQRLYEGPDRPGQIVRRWRSFGPTSPVAVRRIENQLRALRERNDSTIFYERSHSCPTSFGSSGFDVVRTLQGHGFTLQVRNQHHSWNKKHDVNICEEDPVPFMKEFDNSLFQDARDSAINPMFHIDIATSSEFSTTNHDSNCFNLQLTFNTEVEQETNYLVLQQEAGSIQWNDITDKCMTSTGCRNLNIPDVKTSSKIWVIRLKRSLSKLVDALLALIHGKVLFHFLLYYRCQVVKKKKKVIVRMIGISEELYQNPRGLKTAITVAEEDEFKKCIESAPQPFLKKGKLDVKFQKGSECVNLVEFDIGRSDINKYAQWHDHSFDIENLNDNLEVKVMDENANVQWSINLNEMLCDCEPVEQPVELNITVSKPEITTFEEVVMEHQIPWLARRLSEDGKKVAMLLPVDSDEIEGIGQRESAEVRNIRVLKSWRRSSLHHGNRPTWNNIKTVLENDNVRRFDIVRSLLNEHEPSDEVLLWLVPRVAAYFRIYAKILAVPDCEIEMISGSFELLEEKCRAVLQRWRQRTREPTVDLLVDALEHDLIKKYEMAKEMREQFCER